MDSEVINDDSSIRLLDLPVELLVYIITFLSSSKERAKLWYVSSRFRMVCQTPTVWTNFIWPFLEKREQRSAMNVLKACGHYVKRLIFPDHVTPAKIFKMVSLCNNLAELHFPPKTKLDLQRVRSIVQQSQSLEKLKVQLSVNYKPLLQIGDSLKELTVCVPLQAHGVCVSFVEEWIKDGFVLRNLNFVILDSHTGSDDTTQFLRSFLEFLRSLAERRYPVPVDHLSHLKVYYGLKVPLNLFPSLPSYQMDFGQKVILPILKASKFGLTCVETDVLCYAQSTEGVRADNILSHTYGTDIGHMFNDAINSLDFVTEFNLYGSKLRSDDLEKLAFTCPKLRRLNLEGNCECLQTLQGLRMVAQFCSDLCGLNLDEISVADIEDSLEFWEILCSIVKLTHLAVEYCVFQPCKEDARFFNLFQKCIRLEALQLGERFAGPCTVCKTCDVEWSMLSCLPVLKYCSITGKHSTIVQDVIDCCQQLTCLTCACTNRCGVKLSSAYNLNLEQLYIRTDFGNIPNTFLDTVSVHGKLVHVVLVAFSVTVKGIGNLISNSPNLRTLCVFARLYKDVYDNYENIRDFKTSIKRKFPHRKLFSVGTFRLVLEGFTFPPRPMGEVLRNTDLLSLFP